MMNTYDLTPLYRSTVGFDRFATLLDGILSTDTSTSTGYPPYNIEKLDDHRYRISVAIAGFSEDELNVETRDGQLIVSAKKATPPPSQNKVTYLHQGIAVRSFEERFQLADYVRVISANVQNGLLHIDLLRQIPKALKARRIEITK